MPNRPIQSLLQTIQQRAAANGRASPIADWLLGVMDSGGSQAPAPQPQPQPVARPVTPAAPTPSPMASYAPTQRPGGPPAQSPMAAFAPMARPSQPSPMASYAPMERPGPPLPQPNPERVAQAPGGLPAPGWRPAAGTPDVYGPGMAVPAGRSGTIADQPVMGRGFDDFLAYWMPQTMESYGQMQQEPAEPQMVQTTQEPMFGDNPIGGLQRTPGWYGGQPQMPAGAEQGRIVPASSSPLAQSIFANANAGQLPMSPYPFFNRRPQMPFGVPMMGPGV